MTHLLTVRNLAKRYGRRKVLHDVSFHVDSGSMTAVQGENGAGKSTLLSCLVGLARPSAGSVSLHGTFGFCPQAPSLFPALTGRQQVRLASAGYGLPPAETQRRIAGLAQRFDCARHLDTRIGALSGGTAQKINLICAVLHEPRLLILDEPYQGFDHDTYGRFWDFAEQHRVDGGAVLVVSHLHTELDRFDQVIEIADGRSRALATGGVS